ncbi:MAG TPA: NAD(P)H-dependent glycerol-3-phosphate dehydrogenase [Xanthobacteraceae bacterium]|jgi:glycerol-3-phosphate dehydrogenase (NAD(P)+)|nr:NAD(P)H-dependent glycerol-3-phosphate dehydrogenase [Xanthobacteraceae bacterium]
MTFDRIAVVGAGAWGTALANVIARAGRTVLLAARHRAAADVLAKRRESPRLPGLQIDTRVEIAPMGPELARYDAVLLAVPSQQMRAAAGAVAPALRDGTPVIACAKGIERGTHRFMTEVIAETAPTALPAILSGPSFAADVARGLPAAVTLAAGDEAVATALARALGSATLRPYHSTDVRGVEIGGAAKNVLAIAAGIVAGRGLGASAAAALVTRGFAELFRFGRAFGARPETLTGLSGLGDVILTCSSAQSRNYSYGMAVGRGDPAQAVLAEGIFTAPVLLEMAKEKGVDMPIASAVADILAGRASVDAAVEALLTRPFRAEG